MRLNFAAASFPRAAVFAWGLMFAALVGFSIYLCDGTLVYTLDDPYIHLALARNILHGVYGINLQEASSPSSSILWPWMLSLTEFFSLGFAGPLLLNAIAAAGIVYFSTRLIARIGLIDPETGPTFALALAILLIFATSALALPMTGMEHSWHVLLVIVAFDGLIDVSSGKRPSVVFQTAIVVMPLIRFEGAAFSLAAIVALWFLGYRRSAIVVSGFLAAALGGYVIFMTRLSLPVLPSSVLLKSDVMATAYGQGGFPGSILRTLQNSLSDDRGVALLLMAATLSVFAFRQRKRNERLAVYLPVIAAVAAHLMCGAYGWFYRYEVYIMTLGLFGLLYAFSSVRKIIEEDRLLLSNMVVLIVCVIVAEPYVTATIVTPSAARNIFEQQYQMRRFALDFYKRPIAVNDLGLVSYGNDIYVLDLWGLGSENVRKLRSAGKYGPQKIAQLTESYGVGLAVVYDKLFGDYLPRSWRKVAVLHTPQVAAAQSDVSFFVTPHGDSAAVIKALRKLKPSLPSQDSLIFLDFSDS